MTCQATEHDILALCHPPFFPSSRCKMAFISKREKDTTAVLIATRGIPDTQTGYRYIPYSQKEFI